MSDGSTSAEAIDAQLPDLYSGIGACGDIAEQKIDEYAAMIKFIGALAGVGSEDEVARARDAVRQAVAAALAVPDELLAAEEASRLAEQKFLAENRRVFGDESLARDATLRPAIYLTDREYGPILMEDDDWMSAWEANNEARESAIRTAIRLNDEAWDAWIQGWRDWFNSIIEMIKSGNVLQALCTFLAEGVFVLLEEAVIWGASVVAGVVTGGVGAVTVRLTATVTRVGSRSARISVAAARTNGRREIVGQSLDRANTVDAGDFDASDVPEVQKLGDELHDGGRMDANEREEVITPDEVTEDTTVVHGDGTDPDTPRPTAAGRLDKLDDLECFNLPPNGDRNEMLAQLKEQQDVLNSMPASLLVRRRAAIAAAGGTSAIRNPKAQQEVADAFKRNLTRELRDQDFDEDEIADIVKERMDKLAALHRLDIVAGGDPEDVSRMGDRQINSSIGPQWTKNSRIGTLETYATEAVASGRGGDLLNVELRMC